MTEEFNVIDSAKHPTRNRLYYLADTALGRVIYYTMEADNHETATYKNLTAGDFFWLSKPLDEFLTIFGAKPIETFVSDRLKGFSRDKVTVDGGVRYWLAEKSKPDGWLYEIPATEIRAFPATRYPDMKFVYTRYNIAAMRTMNRMRIEQMKTEETMRFNREWIHSEHAVSAIVDAVHEYVNGKGVIF